VPVVKTPDDASRDIPLTVLSASVHSHCPEAVDMLKALALALKTVQVDDEDTATAFTHLTEAGLAGAPSADLWRHLMAVDVPSSQ
jgi:hypothetical protein